MAREHMKNRADWILLDLEKIVQRNRCAVWLDLYKVCINLEGLSEANKVKQVEVVASLAYKVREQK